MRRGRKIDENRAEISETYKENRSKNKENVPKGGRALRARPPLGMFSLSLNDVPYIFH